MFLKTIREAAIAAMAGLTSTGPRVYDQQPYSLAREHLPCLVVSASAPEVLTEYADDTVIRADVLLEIECYVEDNEVGAGKLDAIVVEVQVALGQSIDIGGHDLLVELRSIDAPEFSGEGERVQVRRRLSYVLSPVTVLAADLATFV